MKFRLDAPHYIDDMYLERGTEIGDGTGISFRFQRNSNTVRPDGKRNIVKAGDRMIPSVAMIPLDDEAKAAYKERFGELPMILDPVDRNVPLMGNVHQTPTTEPGRAPPVGAKGPTASAPPPAEKG